MDDKPANLKSLVELGFTELEAEIYAYLLQNSPATGYRVANDLGKPTANTYKAIQRLFEKGAIMLSDGESRMCRAIPVKEFLRSLGRRFESNCREVEASLENLETSPDCDFVYRLRTVDQVYERLRQLLAGTEKVAVLDLFPDAAEILKTDIEAAADRGISVVLKLYRPMPVSGCAAVVTPDGNGILERWPGTWANGVFDGGSHLLSLLSRDGRHVHYAIWSANAYVSWVYHSALAQELILAATGMPAFEKDSIAMRIDSLCCSSSRDHPSLPGLEFLQSQLADYEKASARNAVDTGLVENGLRVVNNLPERR